MDIHALYMRVSSKNTAIKRQPPTAFETASKCNFSHYRSPFAECEVTAYFLRVYRSPVCLHVLCTDTSGNAYISQRSLVRPYVTIKH